MDREFRNEVIKAMDETFVERIESIIVKTHLSTGDIANFTYTPNELYKDDSATIKHSQSINEYIGFKEDKWCIEFDGSAFDIEIAVEE